MSENLNRRTFMKAAALAAGPAIISARGANDKINVGWIGVGTRGRYGLEWLHDQASAVLALLGWPDALGPFAPLDLLYNQWAVVIALVHIHLPFMVLPIYAVLEKLDRAHLEASLDLGAGHWRTFRSIVVPPASWR